MPGTNWERIRTLDQETARAIEERKTAVALMDQLAKVGILAVYGGGSRSKGFGFWLYRASPETIARFRATGGWTSLEDTTVIRNDGKNSGNPFFTMFADAAKMVKEE